MAKATIGQSQDFVLDQGLRHIVPMSLREVGINSLSPYWALVDAKGNLRVFAELTADSDRPDVRPRQAYHAMLSSMFPGWTVRVLQLFWPDPVPRQVFQCQVETCRVGAARKMNGENAGATMSEGRALLREGLLLFVQSAPLPFARRTILEFVLVDQNESLAWWEGVSGMLQEFGLCVRSLSAEEILPSRCCAELARWVFNPNLEG